MNVRPQAIGSKWTVTCRKRLMSRGQTVTILRAILESWMLRTTSSSSKFLRPIIMTWCITRTELNFRLNFPQLCVQFCCFRFTIDFHKHLNIQWAATGYGGIIILGKEGNKTPSSMNEELPSNERIVGGGAAGRDGLQQCKFSLNGMTSSFVSLVAGYAQ